MQEIWKTLEDKYRSIKGSFSTEQFGVFLNMYSFEVADNYLVAFHEDYHYWQSIFTPVGHLRWGANRSSASEIIDAWLNATANTPTKRRIPAASILQTNDANSIACVSRIWTQYMARQISDLIVRNSNNTYIKKMFPQIDPLSPYITVKGNVHELNGIDIFEGLAKFQEAVLAYIAEEKTFQETINTQRLSPEYYIALQYFIENVGRDRILEFPTACELALCACEFCMPGQPNWKNNHPAWRFIKIVDAIINLDESQYLHSDNITSLYVTYANKVLDACGFVNWSNIWQVAKTYASKEKSELTKDMLRAIEFKQQYPWVLAYPFVDVKAFHSMIDFRPYYYITTDGSGYVVKSANQGNEVILENQYQALANQICGIMSDRCIDRGRIQCGYSYYGIRRCPYLLEGACDGHIDRDSNLPGIEMDMEGNIVNGCAFDVFLSLMGVRVKDLTISDISKKIDPQLLVEMINKYQ